MHTHTHTHTHIRTHTHTHTHTHVHARTCLSMPTYLPLLPPPPSPPHTHMRLCLLALECAAKLSAESCVCRVACVWYLTAAVCDTRHSHTAHSTPSYALCLRMLTCEYLIPYFVCSHRPTQRVYTSSHLPVYVCHCPPVCCFLCHCVLVCVPYRPTQRAPTHG